MENEQTPKPPPNQHLGLALLLGFLPSVLLLLLIGGAASGSRGPGKELLWLVCLASVFCCLGSSFLLFRRGTLGAIMGGLLLLLLNGFIAFFLGCCATINL